MKQDNDIYLSDYKKSTYHKKDSILVAICTGAILQYPCKWNYTLYTTEIVREKYKLEASVNFKIFKPLENNKTL